MRRKLSPISHDYGGMRLHDNMNGIPGVSKWVMDGVTIVAFLLLNASLKCAPSGFV